MQYVSLIPLVGIPEIDDLSVGKCEKRILRESVQNAGDVDP